MRTPSRKPSQSCAVCRSGHQKGLSSTACPIPARAVDRVRPDLDERAADRRLPVAEDLARDRAGGDARRGLARRGAAAAAIVADAVFLPVGVVGVAGPETVLDRRRSPCERASSFSIMSEIGVPVVRPSNTPERICTWSVSRRCVVKRDWPGRGGRASAGCRPRRAADQRRHAVDDAADRRPVAFAPGGEAEERAEAVARHEPLARRPRCRARPPPSCRRRDSRNRHDALRR